MNTIKIGIALVIGILVIHHSSFSQPAQKISNIASAEDQLGVKKVLRIGIECNSSLSSKSGTYSIKPGLTFGYSTGFVLAGGQRSALIMGLDMGFIRVMGYEHIDTEYWEAQYKYRKVYDVERNFPMAEFGIQPTYLFPLTENISLGPYVGMHAGLGRRSIDNTLISSTIIDRRDYYGYYEPDSYGNYRLMKSVDAGAKLYIKQFMLEFQYRYVSVVQEQKYHNLYVQLGYVL